MHDMKNTLRNMICMICKLLRRNMDNIVNQLAKSRSRSSKSKLGTINLEKYLTST